MRVLGLVEPLGRRESLALFPVLPAFDFHGFEANTISRLKFGCGEDMPPNAPQMCSSYLPRRRARWLVSQKKLSSTVLDPRKRERIWWEPAILLCRTEDGRVMIDGTNPGRARSVFFFCCLSLLLVFFFLNEARSRLSCEPT